MEHDLVGEPFAVIESDPSVFTSLARRLGITGAEFVELYDIEPWAVDHLNPLGLVFCFLWRKDAHRLADFDDPAAERVWFANQLSDDACASQALLNIALNCPALKIGGELAMFKQDTERMSPVMKGLAISGSPFIRTAHRALARPSDLRGSLHSAATTTLDAAKNKTKPVSKRATATASKKPKKETKPAAEEQEEVYHFIGYVPAQGKVWELDGLKSGPLEVGELPDDDASEQEKKTWMDVVRPALRMKMQKYGGAAGGSNIRFCLLALVEGNFEKASDALEYLKREKISLERKMPESWESLVDPNRLEQSKYAFVSPIGSAAPGPTYAADFGARRMERDMELLRIQSPQELIESWERCVQSAVKAKVALEDEVAKSYRANTEHVKRTHDYEPFIKEYIAALHNEGILEALLSVNSSKNKKHKKDN
ncbi:Ubiquitin c-terminal hydrolase [Mycena indigotica]|uniref:ubiquitinyl hydrolase 1 n=1 Tax=Mycena indigotica TaxID=2126181 RepID=A0A8H6SH51_9AGAR|nr:Ubiquitin c-terminal hydrolase [Mycena indigotica]KAF7298868.1 Ubiquitin c-terminal hydrolase [Mycena indigotica]